jgi:hypothetical protein
MSDGKVRPALGSATDVQLFNDRENDWPGGQRDAVGGPLGTAGVLRPVVLPTPSVLELGPAPGSGTSLCEPTRGLSIREPKLPLDDPLKLELEPVPKPELPNVCAAAVPASRLAAKANARNVFISISSICKPSAHRDMSEGNVRRELGSADERQPLLTEAD